MIIQESLTVTNQDWTIAIKFLEDYVDLSKTKLKDAMNKGCVWRTRRGVRERIRRAQTEIRTDDVIEVFYNPESLMYHPKEVDLVEDRVQYSVWNKPVGMPIQGDDWGDYNSLMRQVELMCQGEREVYQVQELDAEESGVVIIAHQKKTAASLNKLFQSAKVKQSYRVEALGEMPESGELTDALDGKSATSQFQRVSYNDHGNSSKVDAQLQSGIVNQLRRHLELSGHPVMGDALYGEGNDNRGGIRLRLTALELECPVKRKKARFSLY